jgi:predicted ribonuclease YlaK
MQIERKDYTGWKVWEPDDGEWSEFYANGRVPDAMRAELVENEYLIVMAKDGSSTTYCYEGGAFRKFTGQSIKLASFEEPKELLEAASGKKKRIRKYSKGRTACIAPRNIEQSCAIDLLKDRGKTVKLITGTWGTGKCCPNSTLIPTPSGPRLLGELKVGDYVFSETGAPTMILGVFPQGSKEVYRITLNDGRTALCSSDHIWHAMTVSHGKMVSRDVTTQDMINRGVYHKITSGVNAGTKKYRYYLPVAAAVEYSTKSFSVDPYVVGSFIGNGCNTSNLLSLSSNDNEQVEEVRKLLGSPEVIRHKGTYTWLFRLPVNKQTATRKNFLTREVFKSAPELICKSYEKRIPEAYLYGDIWQRTALLQGLLDTDGSVSREKARITYSSTSKRLVEDVVSLCHSLGLCTGNIHEDKRDKYVDGHHSYSISIQCQNDRKAELFRLSRKRNRCLDSLKVRCGSQHNTLTIRNIEDLGYEEQMTCLYVDNPTHLFLTENYIVTHNTMLMVTAALEALKNGEFDRIIWIRNNVDVKGTKDLGALPGEVLDKLLPYLGPFIDHAGEASVKTMIERETLVVEPLQSLRGRNFSNAIIMCSEAENLTREHIQLIIARAAEGSEVWLDADNRQRDKAEFERSKGVETLIDRLAGNRLFGYVHLVKSERSETAALADLLN